jgi:cytochrome c oxidase assembly protein subunit 15
MVVQGIIGYTQFFTHLPAVLVGFHVLGASLVWSTALWFHHGLSDHRPEVLPPTPPMAEPRGEARPGTSEIGRPSGPGPDAVAEPV